MTLLRKSTIAASVGYYVFALLLGGPFWYMEVAGNQPIVIVAGILLVGAASGAVLIIEMLRLATPATQYWDEKRHFGAVGIACLILAIISVLGMYHCR